MGLNHRAALSNITNFKREAFGKHASQSILEDSVLVRRPLRSLLKSKLKDHTGWWTKLMFLSPMQFRASLFYFTNEKQLQHFNQVLDDVDLFCIRYFYFEVRIHYYKKLITQHQSDNGTEIDCCVFE